MNSTKLSAVVLARENLQEVFVMLLVVAVAFPNWRFFISLLFDVILHLSVSYRRVFIPILYFQPSSSQSDSRHFHFKFPGPFRHSLPLALRFWASVFYLSLLPHTLAHFSTQMRAGTPHPGSSFVLAPTKLCLPVDAWSWTTHIVDTRPLVY